MDNVLSHVVLAAGDIDLRARDSVPGQGMGGSKRKWHAVCQCACVRARVLECSVESQLREATPE